MRNLHDTNKQELLNFLKNIDGKLPHKIVLVAIGGTALTLLNLKDSTKDIDFDIPLKKDEDALLSLFKKLDFEQESFAWFTPTGLRIDIFKRGYIFCSQLPPDYVERSTVALNLDKIVIKTLSLEDIIVTKLGRGDERDFIDIKQIYLHASIDNEQLTERFFEITQSWPDSPEMIRQKLLDLIEIKFSQWNFTVSAELVQRVKTWDI